MRDFKHITRISWQMAQAICKPDSLESQLAGDRAVTWPLAPGTGHGLPTNVLARELGWLICLHDLIGELSGFYSLVTVMCCWIEQKLAKDNSGFSPLEKLPALQGMRTIRKLHGYTFHLLLLCVAISFLINFACFSRLGLYSIMCVSFLLTDPNTIEILLWLNS